MAKKKTTSKKSGGARRKTTRKTSKRSGAAASASAAGKHLVIVESPAKAKTINKYLGADYKVMASVGHIRDLPSKSPKGDKRPVPGVDLENNFEPTYEILSGKNKVVSDLKRAAKGAKDIWFATDLDREGEAIAWHLAQILGVTPSQAKRVVFNAITKTEIQKAFSNPHSIDENKVNAQQARRVLDRIVGYQVSPLLWKKVGRGLSAGRVQSVAVRLVVEREREIRAFVPDENWRISACFALDPASADRLLGEWRGFIDTKRDDGSARTIKDQNAWLAGHEAIRAELVDVGGEKFDISCPGAAPRDLSGDVAEIAKLAGLTKIQTDTDEDSDAKGPAQHIRTVRGVADTTVPYRVVSIETKRTTSRPGAPFITSTLQQAASSRLGFGAQRTMRAAQQLYEGVDVPGEGSVGLITYMRTDSTNVSQDAIDGARAYIKQTFGERYLPEKPTRYSSSNKAAQEAHEAIRPTSMLLPPDKIKGALKPDQLKLYTLIWNRFISCQMTPAQWDSTAVLIRGGTDRSREVTFRTTGRSLVFDGFYRVSGVPVASDEQTLPTLSEEQKLAPFSIDPEQKFTSPPPRFTEASLIKTLESEGIGRPSTYASIIQVIQDRKYVEQIERRFYATDLGEVVTDKLIEAFPRIMEIGYTRDLERRLDLIEEEHADWTRVLHAFYKPFVEQLEKAHEEMTHAKAETQPAPDEYKCEKCGAGLVYRFGKNGRFLSCSQYPKCDYACPIDREGKPKPIETADIACHKCGGPMIKRSGRFGPFFGCAAYPECDGILKADKQGRVLAPSPPPLETDLPCAKCEAPLVLRSGARGPWLSCSKYPKCRGRGKWTELSDDVRKKWEIALAEHEKKHPIPIICDLSGDPLTDKKGKPLEREEDAGDGDTGLGERDASSAAA
ncbi:MAG: type I DNA topoisomerase [Phycisphaeraceae bacterium]|nr:MAG: type I DNA topoisomerase [Phycisphaeraceae bacterium]